MGLNGGDVLLRLTNLRKEHLATILGLSLGVLTITYPHQAFGAPSACLSGTVEARLKQRETALLGPGHAEQHGDARAHRCRVVQGLEEVARPKAQALAVALAAQPNNIVGHCLGVAKQRQSFVLGV